MTQTYRVQMSHGYNVLQRNCQAFSIYLATTKTSLLNNQFNMQLSDIQNKSGLLFCIVSNKDTLNS